MFVCEEINTGLLEVVVK